MLLAISTVKSLPEFRRVVAGMKRFEKTIV